MKDINLKDTKSWDGSISLDDGLVLGRAIIGNEGVLQAQRMNYITMALCVRGECSYAIDTRKQQVKAGDLLFISERHIIDYYDMSSDFECQSIMLSTEFYHSFVMNVKNVSSLLLFSTKHPVVALTGEEAATYSNFYETIRMKVAHVAHPYRTELVKALLLAMFYDMSGVIWRVEEQEQKPHARAEVLFAMFIKLLEENFRSERRVSWYAEQLEISPKYLSEMVKRVSKRTPNDWIDHYVVLELRVLLKNSTMSIYEISEQLNFPNQSFLGKYFKQRMGMSPTDYRNQ